MVRLVGLGRWGHRARPVAAGPMYSMRVALGLCLIACLTGTDSSQSSAQQQDREGQTVDTAEMAGMHELFDDLDADNDQNFEQQELRGMMAQLGLDSKNTRAWKWKDALRKMDGDNNELLSKREVINHMTRVRMSKRQVADWLTHAVGLTMYTDKFLANSITGHDLPALLEDGGDHILQDELGITSQLHRKQLRRAIVARLLGDPAPRPPPLMCEPGAEAGSIVLSWEADDGEDDDDDDDDDDDGDDDVDDDSDSEYEGEEEEVTYRVRRQDPITKEWQTVSAGSSTQAFFDAGLDASSSYSYKLDAWSIAGVSEKREKRGCLPKQGGQTTLWRYCRIVADIFMSMEVVGLVFAAGLTAVHVKGRDATAAVTGTLTAGAGGAATAAGAAAGTMRPPPPLAGASSAPIELGLSRRTSAGSDSSSGGGASTNRSSSVDDLRAIYSSAAPNGQFVPKQRTTGGSPPQAARYDDGSGTGAAPRGRPAHGGAVNIQKDYGPFAAAKKCECPS
jgi:hypothetical protein